MRWGCITGPLRCGGEKKTFDNHVLVIGDAAGQFTIALSCAIFCYITLWMSSHAIFSQPLRSH